MRSHQVKIASGLPSNAWYYLSGGKSTARKWTDTDNHFRQESYFYYATSVNEPDYGFAFDGSAQRSYLVMPNFESDHALWMGPVPSKESILKKYGVDVVVESSQLFDILSGASEIHVLEKEPLSYLNLKVNLNDTILKTVMTEARVIKSPHEVELMRAAAKISGNAHITLMKTCKPGVGTESSVQALFEYECQRNASPDQAYLPIVAAGRNGSVLHYHGDGTPMPTDPSQLVLVDAGCELGLYASDITRCFPIGGKFVGDYKTTYEIVLDSQKAVLNAMKPGVKWEDMHHLASDVILDGLVRAGLVHGPLEELKRHHIVTLFFPHGLGHLLGLDVHDCGGYPLGVERIDAPGIKYLRMRRTLVPGMAVTVEPGVYFVDAILEPALKDPIIRQYLNVPVVERFWKNVGGVRIEDDVIITETGIDNLTGWIPKEISDIESLMLQ